MKRFTVKKYLAATLLIVLAAVIFGEADSGGKWRYKTTVIVETPEGIKSASAVREVIAARGVKIFSEDSAGHAYVVGEAVVVDLGKRGVLFALMRGLASGPEYAYDIVFDAFHYTGGGLTPQGIKFFQGMKNTSKIRLSLEQYPYLVWFRDLRNPKTAEKILQAELSFPLGTASRDRGKFVVRKDRFEELFGEGVRLKEINIQMTTEPVTKGIEGWLPWLSNLHGTLSGEFGGGPGIIGYLTNLDFLRKGK